jgi:hypothetical protein
MQRELLPPIAMYAKWAQPNTGLWPADVAHCSSTNCQNMMRRGGFDLCVPNVMQRDRKQRIFYSTFIDDIESNPSGVIESLALFGISIHL